MPELILPSGHVVLYDECDAELVASHNWTLRLRQGKSSPYVRARTPDPLAGRYSPDKYNKNGRVKTREQYMHRMIMRAKPGKKIDHRNGNGLDNRRQNLRRANNSQNGVNRHVCTGASGFKGVFQTRQGKFQAKTKVNGKPIRLGTFPNKESAARAYDAAVVKYFGEFARTNADLGLLPAAAEARA